MKTHKNLYSRVCDFQNLLKSFYQARKSKSNRDYVIGFEWELEKGLLRIKEELEEQNYRFGQYKKFYVFDPKRRLISAAPFRDRIVDVISSFRLLNDRLIGEKHRLSRFYGTSILPLQKMRYIGNTPLLPKNGKIGGENYH